MDGFSLHTPEQISKDLAARVKALRLARGWKQATLAARSGVSLASLRRFEPTSQVSLQHLLKLAFALNRLDDFDVKAQATVNFKVRSSTISKEDKEELKKLAQTAKGLPGYIIEVKGFADSTGAAAMNEKLSSDRAEAVAGYLVRECNVPVRHIMLPGAMGEFQAAKSEDEAGRAEDRRVEVLVLINKGIAGS